MNVFYKKPSRSLGLRQAVKVLFLMGILLCLGIIPVAHAAIPEVAAGRVHTVGLTTDGTVMAVGDNDAGQCDVTSWTGIFQVAAGGSHTVGLKSDGTVVAVGDNDYGQCDVASWTEIVQVATGGYHTVGLKSDGTVAAVGFNYYGQCDVDSWTEIVQVAVGVYHTVGLKSDGTVVAVGNNDYGQCDVNSWTDIVQVTAGWDHTVGLKSDGTVVAVGDNVGQCDVDSWTDIVQVAAGGLHTVGLKSDGTVVAVGYNADGQCDVTSWTDIVQVAAGGSHTVGLKPDGTVVAVGDNYYYGQCDVSAWDLMPPPCTYSLGSTSAIVCQVGASDSTVSVDALREACNWSAESNDAWITITSGSDYTGDDTVAYSVAANLGESREGTMTIAGETFTVYQGIVQVAAGGFHTVGLKPDGTVVAVGDNFEGQCDVNSWTDIVQVAAGSYHTVGLKADGTVVAVGDNYAGQCDVDSWTDIVQVTTGWAHTVGLKPDGTLVAVGNNDDGQCDVTSWTDIVQVTAGWDHTVGLKTDDTVVAVGNNDYGQCDVTSWTDIVQVAAGGLHTVGLKSDGTVVAVGDNTDGQCDVTSWTDIVQVAPGYSHTVGLKTDDTVVAVGNNDYGQCDVTSWTDIVQVAAGGLHTVGLKSDGTVVAVGYNDYGQCDWDLALLTDLDADGLLDDDEIIYGTDPNLADTDGDGIDDGDELAYWGDPGYLANQDGDGEPNNLLDPDSDNDGFSDGAEISAGTNPGDDTSSPAGGPQVAAGGWHTVGLRTDGTVLAVGSNSSGQCNVTSWTEIIQVTAGLHTVGLKSDGTVAAVGNNDHGQCNVTSWTEIVQVAAGRFHTVGLKPDGTVVAVGSNTFGQCDVTSWTEIAQVAAGEYHTVALKPDGTVVAVGDNTDGQCDVTSWADIVQVAAGYKHTVGLTTDGTVLAVGDNDDGQCDVTSWTDIVQVTTGWAHTVGLKPDGTVVAVGDNTDGQCDVTSWTDIVQVAPGYNHTVGLKFDGTVVAVGNNDYGQSDWDLVLIMDLDQDGLLDDDEAIYGTDPNLADTDGDGIDDGAELIYWGDPGYLANQDGDGEPNNLLDPDSDNDGFSDGSEISAGTNPGDDTSSPAPVPAGGPQLAAGGYHTVGLKPDGTVVAVGNNDDGQCDVTSWTDIVQVATKGSYTVGLKPDGTVVAVGDNHYGQCDVTSWTDIVQVAPGDYLHNVGLKTDGTVVAVGNNNYGQLDVTSWTEIVQVAAGANHTVGLKVDGTVVAVGYNGSGRCDVTSWTDIVQVTAGWEHTVGLKLDGTVVAVGNNDYGQCDVTSWTDIVQVTAGLNHTVGLKPDGTVVAVGRNSAGQCDVDSWTDIVQVAAGSYHTVGLKPDGTVVAVGSNVDGQCDWNLLLFTDLDEDGLLDDEEVIYGTDPNLSDTDGDGIDDGNELIYWGDPGYLANQDGDGEPNNLLDPDSDNDGFSDGSELSDGTNPADDTSSPAPVPAGGPQVDADWQHTVGLKADGTVVAVGDNTDGQCDVTSWTDIVQVAAGRYHTVGLKADGTVVAEGDNYGGQCDVTSWTDIVQVAAGDISTVGLKSDGTVVAVGSNYDGECNVTSWIDIVQVAAGRFHTVGLKADGTVVAVGDNGSGRCDVDSWTDIVQVAAGGYHTVGLKPDGTIVAVGWNDDGQCDVTSWTDIVQVAAGDQYTVGLKPDGTVVAVGDNSNGQCNVTSWTDIVQVAAGRFHTIGLKTDGTVVAVGNNDYSQCDVDSWDLTLPPFAVAQASAVLVENYTSIDFDGTGSSDPDGTIIKYAWDFNDGSDIETGATVSHTFTSYGDYAVTLTVTDNDSDTDVAIINICVEMPAMAGLGSFYVVNNDDSTVSRANRQGGYAVNLGNPDNTLTNPVNVAVGPSGYVYFTNFDDNTVSRCNLDGTGGVVLGDLNGTLAGPDGIAIDRSASFIYVVNRSNNTISRADLDGNSGVSLGNLNGTLNIPHGIAIDTTNDRLYVTNQGDNTVSRANLDGSDGTSIGDLNGTVRNPYGIAVDDSAGQIYVVNRTDDTISRADLDGNNAESLGNLNGLLINPHGIAIDQAYGGSKMYVVSRGDNTVVRANLDGSGAISLGDLGGILSDPIGIAYCGNFTPIPIIETTDVVVETDENVFFDVSSSIDLDGPIVWYEWDFDSNGIYDFGTTAPLASHMYPSYGTYYASVTAWDAIGGGGSIGVYVYVEPHVESIIPGKMYVTNYADSTVSSANLDGSDGVSLGDLDGKLSGPSGIAIYPETDRMYVANRDSVTISRASLDGSNGISFGNPNSAMDSPYGVVLDPGTGIINVFNANSNKMSRIRWDGSYGSSSSLAGTLSAPYGAAIDPDSGMMYVVNTSTNTISRGKKDGSEFIVWGSLDGTLNSPRDIAIDTVHDTLYVTNSGDNRIIRADLDGTNVTDLSTFGGMLNNPHGIAVDADAERIYVVNRGSNSIISADLDGYNREDLGNLNGTLNDPIDIAIVPAPCSFALPSNSAIYDESSGTGSVVVDASSEACDWTALSNDGWITITSGSDYTGDDTVAYSVTANGDTLPRTGTMTIVGQTFTVMQCGTEVVMDEVKLTAADGAENDHFGEEVAISGDTAVVGSPYDDDSGDNSGSAYVYQSIGCNWVSLGKLTASDAAAGDFFGGAVGVSGDQAVIGAFGNDDNGSTSGSAYIFQYSAGVWTEATKLTASDGANGDNFGCSAAISGNTAVIGATSAEMGKGSAYVYEKISGTWTETAELTASDGEVNDFFGLNVAISDDVIMIGAPRDDSFDGSTYVFEKIGGTWTQTQKLTGTGYSEVSMDGDMAAIGDEVESTYYNASGAVFVYEKYGGVWTKTDTLRASDAANYDAFGSSVSISGDYVVIGASCDDDNGQDSGSTYIFENTGATWSEVVKLNASDGTAYDGFGRPVALSGDYAVVGAINDDDNGDNSGSAYVYDITQYLSIPVVNWETDSQTVDEAVGTVTVTAQLSETSGDDIPVPFTVSGTAESSGVDHDLADGSITITAGSLTGSETFNINDDADPESDETVVVTMGTPTNADPGTILVQTITIEDNDTETDGDGISDWDEINVYGTDPDLPDTDGDGIDDGNELIYWGDPGYLTDHDGDAATYANNLLDPDSDNDGFNDGYELNAGTDPGDDASYPTSGEILWNTFQGSFVFDEATGIAADDAGDIYIVGESAISWGTPINGHSGGNELFVAKLDSDGALLWNTFLGSSDNDYGEGIVVDAAGSIYVVGTSFATWGSPINPFAGGVREAFVAKLNSSGALQWNTFMGSSTNHDFGKDIAADAAGNLYVTGYSSAPWGTPINGGDIFTGAFVAKLNSTGNLQWNTFLGSPAGADDDWGEGIVVATDGSIYVSGFSDASWGTPINAHMGDSDIFVAKLNSGGTLQWNTFMGSSTYDDFVGISTDGNGEVYVSGESGATWGTPVNAFDAAPDVFVAKLNGSGALQWNTFMPPKTGGGIAVDATGNIYVGGTSGATWGTPISAFTGNDDVFIAKLNSGGTLQWNTFMGSSFYDDCNDLTLNAFGHIFAAGSSDYTWGTPINAHAGAADALVAKLSPGNGQRPPVIDWTTASQSVDEAVGTVTVTAQLSETSGDDVSVPFTVSGTAEGGGVDHDLADGAITITAGSLTGSEIFTINDDADPESDETVIVTMGTPTNAGLGTILVETITIEDNDTDTDGDGIGDWDEINVYGTDPDLPDTDGDGIDDGDELIYWGDPGYLTDHDGDAATYANNLLDPDSDNDGFNDGDELTSGTDPGNNTSYPLITYTVYGTNTAPAGIEWYDPESCGCTLLGAGTSTKTFNGEYAYYIVHTDEPNMTWLDAFQLSDSSYYNGSSWTGNALAYEYMGPPDNCYTLLGKSEDNQPRRSYVGIGPVSENTGITVIIVDEPALSPSNAYLDASAQSSSIEISATESFPWTALSNDAWITITGDTSGTGPGNINFEVSENTSSAYRYGSISINGKTFNIRQAKAGVSRSCQDNVTYSLYGTNVAPVGTEWYYPETTVGCELLGTGMATKTFTGEYDYYLVHVDEPNVTWLDAFQLSDSSYYNGSSWTGNASYFEFMGAPDGQSTKLGHNFSWGLNRSYTGIDPFTGNTSVKVIIDIDEPVMSPSSGFHDYSAASSSFKIAVSEGSTWTASSNDGWITVTGGGSGSDEGIVTYDISENPASTPRVGSITVNGKTFYVYQCANGNFSWSDNFDGGPAQTWKYVDRYANSTATVVNDRHELETDDIYSSFANDSWIFGLVEKAAKNGIVHARMQQIDPGDTFASNVSLRTDTAGDGYGFGLISNGLVGIAKRNNGQFDTSLSVVPTQISINTSDCQLKFAAIGSRLFGKVWSTGTEEPKSWRFERIDDDYVIGLAGVGVSTINPTGSPSMTFDDARSAFDDVSFTTDLVNFWIDSATSGGTEISAYGSAVITAGGSEVEINSFSAEDHAVCVEELTEPPLSEEKVLLSDLIDTYVRVNCSIPDGDHQMIIKLHYTDAEIAGINETDLRLYSRDRVLDCWKLAVLDNTNGTATWVGDHTPTSTLGDYGVDTADNIVWAVVDHSSEFTAGDSTSISGWSLQDSNLMFLGDESQAEATVTITAGNSYIWIANSPNASDETYPDDSWGGRLFFTSGLNGDQFTIEVGRSTDGTVGGFIVGSPSQTITGNWNMIYEIDTGADGAHTVPEGEYLALRVTNNSSNNYTLMTGGLRSWLRAPVEDDIDTDNDGLLDADEVIYGTDPNLPDTDDDGINDFNELAYWGDPGYLANEDGDGIINNLLDPDSDNDGFNDGDELAAGTDPGDDSSYPAGGEILWNTFMGSTDTDTAVFEACESVITDSAGNIYVTGHSDVTWGSPINPFAGGSEAFVAKFNSNGVLQWNTFLGSFDFDYGNAIAVDTGGNIYVAGDSSASWGSPLNAHSGGGDDVFIARLGSDGTLQWNTFLGSSNGDWCRDIILDTASNIYITGESEATWGSPINSHAGNNDGFAAKFDSSGALQWNTFVGSTGYDFGDSIAIDTASNIYVTGMSDAAWGSPINSYIGSDDAFVVKFDSDGTIQWNTFIGSTYHDGGHDVALDSTGNIYVCGESDATWGSPINAYAGDVDGFVAKLDSTGTLQWNTFTGSTAFDWAHRMAIDTSANIYILGDSGATWGSPINPYAGSSDCYVAKINSSGGLVWHTFIGSTDIDNGTAITLDTANNICVAGSSEATWGSPINAFAGDDDAFLVKISAEDSDNDSDNDGLLDTEEAMYGTDPNDADSDADGIDDGNELAYWGADWDTDYDGDAATYANNLLDPDSDNDGFNDGAEVAAGTDPSDELDFPAPPPEGLYIQSDTTNGSTIFTDESGAGHTVTTNGDVHHETFGADTAIAFDGGGDYLRLGDHDDWDFGTDDFTIDLWVNFTSTPDNYDGIFSTRNIPKSNPFYRMEIFNGTIQWEWASTAIATKLDTGVTPVLNTWMHLAAVRADDTLTLYVDGVSKASTDCTGLSFDSPDTGIVFGRIYTQTDGWDFNGHMDEITVTKGSARWSDNFTPPNSPDVPPAADTDSDGISDDDENNIYGTNPGLADTDSDGIDDGNELAYWGADWDTDYDGDAATYANNLLDPDSDNDGLLDGEEIDTYGTDPALTDTDADGISDWDEINTYLTDPNLPDTDGDGIDDGNELIYWGDPGYLTDHDGDAATYANNLLDPDSDNDGFNDGAEVAAGTDPSDELDFPAPPPEGLYIQSDTTNGSTIFTDESGAGHTVTTNGDVHHETFGADTAIAFDGTGDYLSLADSDDWDFGTDDFTIDLWVNFTSTPDNYDGIFSTRNIPKSNPFYRMEIFNGTIQWEWASTAIATKLDTGVTPVLNTWMHLAAVRADDTLTLYVDGVSKASTDCTGLSFDSPDTGIVFGRIYTQTDGWDFNGHMDEITVTKGSARWSDNFTPPNSPDVPPAADTDSDGISDDDENNIYGTNPGLADTDSDGIDDGNELAYWGADWDTDYDGDAATYANNLLDPDSDNDGLLDGEEIDTYGTDPALTDTDADGISDWDEINTYLTDPNLPDTDGDGIDDGTELGYWNGSAYNWYDDDDSDGLENIVDPDSDNDGFNDGAEVAAGTDPSDELDFPAPPPEGLYIQSDTTNGSTIFTDESGAGHTVTTNGDVHHETFGADTAIAFDGTGDYLSLADSDDWDFGTDDFTIDLWVNFTSTPDNYDGIFSTRNIPKSNPFYRMEIFNGTIQWEWASTAIATKLDTGVTPVLNTWMHLAAVRADDTLTLYVDGVSKASTDCTGLSFDSPDTGIVFGRIYTQTDGWDFNGHMDEITVTKGSARWSDNFTPPNSPDVPPAADTDSDGISDDDENNIYGTNPGLADTDSDGIDDGNELAYWGADWDTDYDGDAATYANNLLDPDSDNDGLLDGEEIDTYGTDPALTDTDADGISDWDEINTYLTDPNLPDTDGDGIDDGTELGYWNGSAYNWYDDDDSDGLENIVDPDSDNDGFNDGAEVAAGTDPSDELDFPAPPPEGLYIQSDTTNGSTIFTDESGAGHTVTTNGDVHHETFGADTAIAFDGTGDYLSLADSDDWDFGTDDFTIDLWVNFTSTPDNYDGIFSTRNIPKSNPFYRMEIFNGTIQWEWASTAIATKLDTGVTPVLNTWMHLAAVRADDTLTLYVDGVSKASTDCTGLSFDSPDTGIVFGRIYTQTDGWDFNGHMDEITVTKGSARWTGNFTPQNNPAP